MTSFSTGIQPPLISVVTISYNCRDDLSRTIESVAGQHFENSEFIIVDGGSADGTLALLEECDPGIRWVSEPDRGIYDAMNKGVAMARGDWICFMNAGDWFATPEVLGQLAPILRSAEADIVYGAAKVVYPEGDVRLWSPYPIARLPYEMIGSHQAMFGRRTLLQAKPFRLGRTASDYAFLIESWTSGCRFLRIETLVACVTAGGVSDVRRLQSVRQRWDILGEAGLQSLPLRAYYAWQTVRAVLVPRLKRVLPVGIVRLGRRSR